MEFYGHDTFLDLRKFGKFFVSFFSVNILTLRNISIFYCSDKVQWPDDSLLATNAIYVWNYGKINKITHKNNIFRKGSMDYVKEYLFFKKQ